MSVASTPALLNRTKVWIAHTVPGTGACDSYKLDSSLAIFALSLALGSVGAAWAP